MKLSNLVETAQKEAKLRKEGYKQYRKTSLTWAREATKEDKEKEPVIKTLEGDMEYKVGDYLCVGEEGERWPVKRSIFEKTYESTE